MFFASVGKENPDGGQEVSAFDYYLADRLGRTVAELADMPHTEYLGWQSYHKVRQQADELAVLRARHG